MSGDHESEQDGPCVWADEPEPVPPAMRMFRVLLETRPGEKRYLTEMEEQQTVYVEAHSVTCVADAAHFYVYRPTNTPEGVVLAAFMVRTLRPYLDCEDVTSIMATTSNKMN